MQSQTYTPQSNYDVTMLVSQPEPGVTLVDPPLITPIHVASLLKQRGYSFRRHEVLNEDIWTKGPCQISVTSYNLSIRIYPGQPLAYTAFVGNIPANSEELSTLLRLTNSR